MFHVHVHDASTVRDAHSLQSIGLQATSSREISISKHDANEAVEPVAASSVSGDLPFSVGALNVEVVSGAIRFYRETAIPIGDAVGKSRTLCIIAVPAHVGFNDLVAFVEPFAARIEHMRVLRDPGPGCHGRYMLLVRFADQAAADDFYRSYQGKPFTALDPEACHAVHVAQVILHRVDRPRSGAGAGSAALDAVGLERIRAHLDAADPLAQAQLPGALLASTAGSAGAPLTGGVEAVPASDAEAGSAAAASASLPDAASSAQLAGRPSVRTEVDTCAETPAAAAAAGRLAAAAAIGDAALCVCGARAAASSAAGSLHATDGAAAKDASGGGARRRAIGPPPGLRRPTSAAAYSSADAVSASAGAGAAGAGVACTCGAAAAVALSAAAAVVASPLLAAGPPSALASPLLGPAPLAAAEDAGFVGDPLGASSSAAASTGSAGSAAAALPPAPRVHGLPALPPPEGLTEMPTCPVCLERLDASSSGVLTTICNHTFHCTCLSQWLDDTCPVCRYCFVDEEVLTTGASGDGGSGSSTTAGDGPASARGAGAGAGAGAAGAGASPDSAAAAAAAGGGRGSAFVLGGPAAGGAHSSAACEECGARDNVWMCLVCGHLGCGRLTREHALRHFRGTQHTYAIELATQRVWDYAGDGFVHRLIQNKTDGKLVEVPDPGAARGDGSRPRTAAEAGPGSATGGTGIAGGGSSGGGGDANKKDSAVALEYALLLTGQLDSQRQFFEGLLAQVLSLIPPDDAHTRAAAEAVVSGCAVPALAQAGVSTGAASVAAGASVSAASGASGPVGNKQLHRAVLQQESALRGAQADALSAAAAAATAARRPSPHGTTAAASPSASTSSAAAAAAAAAAAPAPASPSASETAAAAAAAAAATEKLRSRVAELQAALAAAEARSIAEARERRALSRQVEELSAKAAQQASDIGFLKDLNDTLTSNTRAWEVKAQVLERQWRAKFEAATALNAELEEQVRDLAFALETGRKIAAAPEAMQAEIAAGHMLIAEAAHGGAGGGGSGGGGAGHSASAAAARLKRRLQAERSSGAGIAARHAAAAAAAAAGSAVGSAEAAAAPADSAIAASTAAETTAGCAGGPTAGAGSVAEGVNSGVSSAAAASHATAGDASASAICTGALPRKSPASLSRAASASGGDAAAADGDSDDGLPSALATGGKKGSQGAGKKAGTHRKH